MKQAENNDEREAPRLEIGRDQVLDGDVRDRKRDHRLDDGCRHRDDAVERESQRDRVRDREGGDLREDAPHVGR